MEFGRQEEGHSSPPFLESAFTKPLPSFSPSSSHHVDPNTSPPPAATLSVCAVGSSGEAGVGGGGASGSYSRPSATPTPTSTTSTSLSEAAEAASYRECMRNHAARLGGHVIDGCGEFMPSSTANPMKCAACGCHRSFHRREFQGSSANDLYYHQHNGRARLLLPPPHPHGPHHHKPSSPSPTTPAMGFASNTSRSGGTTTESSSDERNFGGAPVGATPPSVASKKRFRTKFTAEQKEKMLAFAEGVGWRVQRQDDAAIEQLCAEIGVSRRVLKVWMHNNKHSIKRQQQQLRHEGQQQQPRHQEQQCSMRE